MANKQAILGSGARFSGKISNAKSIEINGYVEADLTTEKVTIGSTGKFIGSVQSELVVIAGEYEGKMQLIVFGLQKRLASVEKFIINHYRWIEVLH